MKVILQSEAAECGLASLAMVADHHGFRLGLAELRQRFSLSLKGLRLDHLVQIARRIGFSARAMRVQLNDLPRLACLNLSATSRRPKSRQTTTGNKPAHPLHTDPPACP